MEVSWLNLPRLISIGDSLLFDFTTVFFLRSLWPQTKEFLTLHKEWGNQKQKKKRNENKLAHPWWLDKKNSTTQWKMDVGAKKKRMKKRIYFQLGETLLWHIPAIYNYIVRWYARTVWNTHRHTHTRTHSNGIKYNNAEERMKNHTWSGTYKIK